MFLFVDTYLVYKVVITCLSLFSLWFEFSIYLVYSEQLWQGSLFKQILVKAGSWCRSASRKEDQHLRLKVRSLISRFFCRKKREIWDPRKYSTKKVACPLPQTQLHPKIRNINLSFLCYTYVQGTSPFKEHKVCCQKESWYNLASVNAIEGTTLFRDLWLISWVSSE